MRSKVRFLSRDDAAELKRFLSSPERPDDTLSFHGLQGALFAIASSPETIPPSEWLPIVLDAENIAFRNEREAQTILNHVMALYNEVNTRVLERSAALPAGCAFDDDILANFEESSTISQWARGFAAGHDWLAEVWDEYLFEELDDECGTAVMVLAFFATRQLAEASYADLDPARQKKQPESFEDFARTVRELFPEALASYANLGRTIFEVMSEQDASYSQPVRRTKVGRNEPCPCGSGKKYKKCCGWEIH